MTLICWLIGHAPTSAHYHLQGLQFALCARCCLDLVRHDGAEWQPLNGEEDAEAQAGQAILPAPMPPRRTPPRRHALTAVLSRSYDMRQRHSPRERSGTAKILVQDGVAEPIYAPDLPVRAKAKRCSRARAYRRWWLTHREAHREERR